jgi:hypothetical protein
VRIRKYFDSGGVDSPADADAAELEHAPALPTLVSPGIPAFKAVEAYARISEVQPLISSREKGRRPHSAKNQSTELTDDRLQVLGKRGLAAHSDVEQAIFFLDGVGPAVRCSPNHAPERVVGAVRGWDPNASRLSLATCPGVRLVRA